MLKVINKEKLFEEYEKLKGIQFNIKGTPFENSTDYKDYHSVNIIYTNNNEFLIQFTDNPINILMGEKHRITLYYMENFMENINNKDILNFLSKPNIQEVKNISEYDRQIQKKNYRIYKCNKYIEKLENTIDYDISPRINNIVELIEKFDESEILDIKQLRGHIDKLNDILDTYVSER